MHWRWATHKLKEIWDDDGCWAETDGTGSLLDEVGQKKCADADNRAFVHRRVSLGHHCRPLAARVPTQSADRGALPLQGCYDVDRFTVASMTILHLWDEIYLSQCEPLKSYFDDIGALGDN